MTRVSSGPRFLLVVSSESGWRVNYESFLKAMYWDQFKIYKVDELFHKVYSTVSIHSIEDKPNCWLGPFIRQQSSHHRVNHLVIGENDSRVFDPVPRVSHTSATKIEDGDVILSSSSDRELRVTYVQQLSGRELYVGAFSQAVIRPNKDSSYKLHPLLLAHMIARPGWRQVFENELSHTMVWSPHALWKVVKDLPVPELTEERQEKLAGLIESTSSIMANSRRQAVIYEELCNSILHEYLTKGSVKLPDTAQSSASPAKRERKKWSVIGFYPDNDQAYTGEHVGFTGRQAALDAMTQAEDNGNELVVVEVIEGTPKRADLGPKIINDIAGLYLFTMRYIHAECQTVWEDTYECTCNGQCPKCGTKDITPMMYKDADDDWLPAQEENWGQILRNAGMDPVTGEAPGETP